MFTCICKHKSSQKYNVTDPLTINTIEGKQIRPKIEKVTTRYTIENGNKKEEQPIIEEEPLTEEGDTGLDENITVKRRSGIPGQPMNVEDEKVKAIEIVKHPKNIPDEELIKNALTKNKFLRHLLEGERLQVVTDAMYLREVKAKEVIIAEGTVGSHLYISATGSYEVIIKGVSNKIFQEGEAFGELAILYNTKRQATVQALKTGQVWVLDRNVYQKIMLINAIEEHDRYFNFLCNVPALTKAAKNIESLRRVADLLKCEFFSTGKVIVRQGDRGDKFYIITAGTVTISKDGIGEVGKMSQGEFFGELALLLEDCRQATVTAEAPGVECLTLARADFLEHFIPELPQRRSTPTIDTKNEFSDVRLEELKIIETLGVGGFGRVELVQHRKNKNITFALKYLKKIDMVQQQQQEHALNEKKIQINCNSVFIVRMYKTFRDPKYVYFLMEPCLGGDLWTLLQKQKGRRFAEPDARFFAASILEALSYLHDRSIVYRDLKPENMLLTGQGYLKLTDFGFAKKLGPRGKTFTFAGTPEYVAPEIVLNRGHDRAVDYWAFGIFIFELLVGRTPFRTNDSTHMKTYNLILRGLENLSFPEYVSRSANQLIRKLCRPMPVQRLGCQKEGAQDVKNHKWFLGFDWAKLREQKMKVPFSRSLKSNTDTHCFDTYPKDTDIPPDELSGWDQEF